MSDIDKRLAAFRTATEQVTAPPGFKQRVLAKVRAAAVLPLAAAIGWYGGIGIKLLAAAVAIAGGTAAYQLTADAPTPPLLPQAPVAGVAPAVPPRAWPGGASALPMAEPALPRVVPAIDSGPTPQSVVAATPAADAGVFDAGRWPSTTTQITGFPAAGWGRCRRGTEIHLPARPSPPFIDFLARHVPELRRDLAAEPIPPGGAVYFGELDTGDYKTDFKAAAGRLRVYPDGWFLAATTPDHPVFVNLAGYAPALMVFEGPSAGQQPLFVGRVPLAKLEPNNSAFLRATIRLAGPPAQVEVTLLAGSCSPDDDKLPQLPVKVAVTQRNNVVAVETELALVPHSLLVTARGYAPRRLVLHPDSEKILSPRIDLEREVPLKAEAVTGRFGELQGGATVTTELRASVTWSPAADCPITIGQQEGRYTFSPPIGGRMLGNATLGSYQSALSLGGVEPVTKLELETVYLLKCPDADRWVLVRFSR